MLNKDFYLTLSNLLKNGKCPNDISKELNLSKQALNYYLKPLKIDGIIRKIGYATWQIDDEKFNEFISKIQVKQVKKLPAVAVNHPHSFTSLKPDMVRGHAFQLTLKIPKLYNWGKRREYLQGKGIPFKEIGQGWRGERILIENFKVWLTPISIVVYFPNFKSFIGETAKDTKNYAIYEFKRIISKVESLLNVSFRISNNYIFKISKQHYSLVKNALSKQYDKEGKKLYCYTGDGLWLIIDNSYNLHETENVHPDTALTDNEKVQNWFNGLKDNPITPQQILHIQYNQAKQFEYYADNIKTHTNSIIQLNDGIKIMNKLLKKMDSTLSQTSLGKWL